MQEAGSAMRHAVIGGGVIGEVLVAARVGAGEEVALVETDEKRARQMAASYPVATTSLAKAVSGSSVVWLAVKPQQLAEVLTELDTLLADTDQAPLVISVAAGTNTDQLIKLAPHLGRLVRIMPNTPARIGRGITAIANPTLSPTITTVSNSDLDLVRSLLSPLGDVVEVPETLIDAVSVVAGSGPAYLFYLAEAMTQAGVSLGLEQEVTKRLVSQTLSGAAELLRVSNVEADKLRAEVTSRAGVTFVATSHMDERGVKDDIINAIRAAHDRAKQLGEESATH